MLTPKYELIKTDHGIDGWDAKRILEARFSSKDLAEKYLEKRGYTYRQHGMYYHLNPELRHKMGMLSYQIKESNLVPEDPE